MLNVTNIDEPINGTQAARLSWEIPDNILERLLLNIKDEDLYIDVRSQFALWATTQPQALFEDFAEAWNAFIAPKSGMTRPAVLLPGSACSRCSRLRYQSRDLSRVGHHQCPECKGTGRKPPRAVAAAFARTQRMSSEATGT